jgi:uncharacterized membrane protein
LYPDVVFVPVLSAVTPKNPVLPSTHEYWINALIPLVLIAVVVTGLVLALRRRVATTPVTAAAESILADRFARGEIDEAEFEQRRAALRA